MPRTINTSGTVGITLTVGDDPVSITPAGTIDTGTGTYALYGPASTAYTITNSGFLRDTASGGVGIGLKAGGALTNTPGAYIGGSSSGVIAGGALTINNYGTIKGRGFATGVILNAGGNVTNAAAALIYGAAQGIYAKNTGLTVTNVGVINGGGGSGVRLTQGGGVINTGSIFSHLAGVNITGGAGTVLNGGYIYGVSLPVGYNNVLALVPGARFGSGLVNGGNTVGVASVSTLELLSGASTGIVKNVDNFGSIVFAPGASWTISGSTARIAGGEVFSGFSGGDTINIRGVTNETIAGFANHTLSLGGGANLGVVFQGNYTADNFLVTNGPTLYGVVNTTDITLACFAEGTRILTETGEIPVADLREGDRVMTRFGKGTASIVWKGRRHVRPEHHPDPDRVRPVLIRANAFGEGQPHTDLRLSPDHAVFAGGVLLPIRLLVNGVTIVQQSVPEITYYHLELAAHDVIQAEGLACESYLNTGDRSAFENGGGAVMLHPDFTSLWREGMACAELVLYGPRLTRIRAELTARSEYLFPPVRHAS